jgi:A/G-specific adenine glycosylase
VLDYYARFLTLFPTVSALALAEEPSVLAAWSGLGYYRRAKLLHQAAKVVIRDHQGTWTAISSGCCCESSPKKKISRQKS